MIIPIANAGKNSTIHAMNNTHASGVFAAPTQLSVSLLEPLENQCESADCAADRFSPDAPNGTRTDGGAHYGSHYGGQTGRLGECVRVVGRIEVAGLPAVSGPGIYFLRDAAGEVVYVGKSVNPIARVMAHIGEGIKEFAAADYIACKAGELDVLEQKYIRHFNPKYNADPCTLRWRREGMSKREVRSEKCRRAAMLSAVAKKRREAAKMGVTGLGTLAESLERLLKDNGCGAKSGALAAEILSLLESASATQRLRGRQ